MLAAPTFVGLPCFGPSGNMSLCRDPSQPVGYDRAVEQAWREPVGLCGVHGSSDSRPCGLWGLSSLTCEMGVQ